MSAPRPASRPERLFRRMLALYPREFRERFGGDMTELFLDQTREARRAGGRLAVAVLWLRLLPGLVHAALLEHRDALRPARAPEPLPPRRTSTMENLIGDLRFAARQLRKSPLFAAIAVACIALGSGAVTTIFSTMNALVLRPLPGARDAERLVRIERKEPGSDNGLSVSYPFFEQVRDRAASVEDIGAWSKVSLTIGERGQPGTPIYGNFVSANLFPMLGTRPFLGRFFLPEEDRTERTHQVIVVSHGFWQSRFGADSGIVGRDVVVNGHRFTLVGVMPPEFQGLDAPIKTDAWVPIHTRTLLRPIAGPLRNPEAGWVRMAGRLKPDVTAEQAARELSALAAGIGAEGSEPKWMRKFTDMRLSPLMGLPPDATKPLAGFLGLLLGAAALVLLIASVNVAGLLAARAVARQREMAVRSALGASRGRIVRQLLTELLVLSAAGAVVGIALAIVATNALEHLPIPGDVQFALELSPDPRVFAFALLTSLLTGAIVGLSPARRLARTDVATRLRDGGTGSSARGSWKGRTLVVAQLSLSLLLLVGAGLFVRALQQGGRIDRGFDANGLAVVHLDTEGWGYDEARTRLFYAELQERLAALPEVTGLTITSVMPLGLRSQVDEIEVPGSSTVAAGTKVPLHYIPSDAGYLPLLRIPLVAGRNLAPSDDARAAGAAVVNETLVRKWWPEGNPLGRTFEVRGKKMTVVGVARDAKYASLGEETPPVAYVPLTQVWETKHWLLIRGRSGGEALAPAIRAAIASIDPQAPRPRVTSLEREMGIGLMPQRVAAMVTGLLGLVGLTLAAVGLYGVVAYSVSRRTKELGIRMALGARSADVLRMVVREGMRLTAVGVVVGLVLAAGATRLMASLLFGVSPLDATTYVAMSSVFVAVTLLASWLPARRAAGASPMSALREE